jgi:hypothetical protein
VNLIVLFMLDIANEVCKDSILSGVMMLI